jgi:DNA polymerase-3 subunit alpha
MENKKFCHLHLHTEYSLLDSSAKVKKVISRAKELGMESIAITDHGVMYGCVAFYKEAIAQGIKPILGCEVYVASKSMNIKINDKDNGTYHLVLLVKNEKGYENLMEIVSSASINQIYSPLAFLAPRFLTAAAPCVGQCNILMIGNFLA